MKYKELPPLSAIDRKDKLILWLDVEVLEQNYDAAAVYELLENHFALVSTWRELKRG